MVKVLKQSEPIPANPENSSVAISAGCFPGNGGISRLSLASCD